MCEKDGSGDPVQPIPSVYMIKVKKKICKYTFYNPIFFFNLNII